MQNFKSLLLILVSIVCCVQLSAQSAFINEINYLSSDPANRGLEIAGEAGESLDGWSVVIYYLDGTVAAVEYLENQLIPSQQNGYGTVWYEMDQMGGGDGVALVNPAGNVVQFLSYGVTDLVASQGPAAGMAADYIGSQHVPEKSMQLMGTGLVYLDFAWSVAAAYTPGGVNVDQVFGMLPGLRTSTQTSGKDRQLNNVNKLTINTFPNPTTDYIQVQIPAALETAVQLRLMDMQGRMLHQNTLRTGDVTSVIDMADLPRGTYILRIHQGQTLSTQKIVKQ